MTQTFQAAYKNGVLKPLQPQTGLHENDEVAVTIHTLPPARPFDGWVGGVSDEDAAAMRTAIEQEFERIDPDDWK